MTRLMILLHLLLLGLVTALSDVENVDKGDGLFTFAAVEDGDESDGLTALAAVELKMR